MWAVLLEQMKKRAEAKQRFGSHLSDEMRLRLDVLEKETTVAAKKCVELGTSIHAEMQKAFRSTDDALKNYHHLQGQPLGGNNVSFSLFSSRSCFFPSNLMQANTSKSEKT